MGHLFRKIGNGYAKWSNGFAYFHIDREEDSQRLIIAVNCKIGDIDGTDLALLDTAAEWSIIGGETAQLLEEQLSEPIGPMSMDTRLGTIHGTLNRVNITLLAEKNCGNDIMIDGTILVAPDWHGPTVLGFRGCLERIRVALDPGVFEGSQIFFFGAD